VSAQVYRWTDQNGTVHYSSSAPPPGTKATRLDIEVKSAPEQAAPPVDEGCYTVRCQGLRLEERLARREALEARLEAERAAQAPRQPRGLEFRKYISIQRGMSEGELIVVAGEPDLLAHDGLAVRTYVYLPTVADPFTTNIRVLRGRVADVERVRKF
jgi:hypothetical protein